MKKLFVLLIILIILIMLLTACSRETLDDNNKLPFFNEARIKVCENETYIFRIKSYEIMGSMILI